MTNDLVLTSALRKVPIQQIRTVLGTTLVYLATPQEIANAASGDTYIPDHATLLRVLDSGLISDFLKGIGDTTSIYARKEIFPQIPDPKALPRVVPQAIYIYDLLELPDVHTRELKVKFAWVELIYDLFSHDGKHMRTERRKVFLRSDAASAAVKLVNEETGETYLVFIELWRDGPGTWLIDECPAGMLEYSEKSLAALMLREVAEEVGLKPEDLADKATIELLAQPAYVSPGGSNERIALFEVTIELNPEQIACLVPIFGGEEKEGEFIRNILIKLPMAPQSPEQRRAFFEAWHDIIDYTNDMKSKALVLFMYAKALEQL